MKKIKVSPSILAADFCCLEKELKKIVKAKADLIHIDVMDGNFVPNITMGPCVVAAIRKIARLPLNAHLMIESPQRFIPDFVKSGADIITLHTETISSLKFKVESKKLRRLRKKIGVALNPDTPISRIKGMLKYTDLVLVMSVYPGFSGQKFMPEVLYKIRALRKIYAGDIEVDGGINDKTAKAALLAGANILAAASYIFKAKNYRIQIERLKNAKTG